MQPPLTVEVSDPIPAPAEIEKVCYVIYTAESDLSPHFLNGRQGVWVRTDEFSQRYEPRLATETEIRHLLDRRRSVEQRRMDVVKRSKERFKRAMVSEAQGPVDMEVLQSGPRLECSLGPRYPAQPVCTQAKLVEIFNNSRIDWRQTGFPQNTASISQHESVLRIAPGETPTMVEVTVWGMLFYGTALSVNRMKEAGISGIHLYSLVGHLLVFVRHANKMLSGWAYNGSISIEVELDAIRKMPWIYMQGGLAWKGPVSEFDDNFSFSLESTTEDLRQRSDGVVKNLLEFILFGMNWADIASNSTTLEDLLIAGYKYNGWRKPEDLTV